MAVGVPTATGPAFTFDMATSAIALFGVLTSKSKGEPLPPNVAYGKDGEWTTDATEAYWRQVPLLPLVVTRELTNHEHIPIAIVV
jgi:LDH2 family malate/lactate/ureidoglycolate dehydrogenase